MKAQTKNNRSFSYTYQPEILVPDLQHDIEENFFKGIWGTQPKEIIVQIPGRLYAALRPHIAILRERIAEQFNFPSRQFKITDHNNSAITLAIKH